MDKRRGTHIEATRRLRGDEQGQRPRALTRDDHLLLVASRETTSLRRGGRSAYVKGVHQAGGGGGDGGAMSHHTAGKRPLIIRVQHQVVDDSKGLDHAVFMAIFRN